MTDQREFNQFETKLIDSMQVDAPTREFVAGLWQTIQSQPAARPSRPSFDMGYRPFRWVFVLAAFVIVLAAFLAIGPSRVIAALQSLLQYVPGLGYVDDSSSLRIVRPTQQTRDGITVSITAGVVDGQKTIIRYTVTGAAVSHPEPGKTKELCSEWPYLTLPDGSALAATQGEAGTTDSATINGKQSFLGIPAGVDTFDLVFPCLMQTVKTPAEQPRVLSLQLEPMPADYPVYDVIDLPASGSQTDTSTPEAAQPSATEPLAAGNPSGITLEVERMAELPDGYLFEGSLSWPTGKFNFAHMWTFDLQLVDAAGEVVPVEEAPDMTPEVDLQSGTMTWAVRALRKDIAFPLQFNLARVNVSRSMEQPAFFVDLGETPRIGQSWDLEYEIDVDGTIIKLIRATLVKPEFGPGDIYYLELSGESPIGRDVSVSFASADPAQLGTCANGASGGGGGGGGGMDSSGNGGSFSTVAFLGCQPHGKIELKVTGESYDLAGPWQASVAAPPK